MRSVRRIVPVIALLGQLIVSEATAQSPPPKPASGPGGSDQPHAAVTVGGPFWTGGRFWRAEDTYFIYEPAAPAPATAPVVLFLHGYQAIDPIGYMGWIRHMVRKGYIVVWVQYQTRLGLPGTFTDNAMEAWKDALRRLDTGRHVRPARDGSGRVKTAMVGHSFGGYMGALLAARAANTSNRVPRPYAIVAVEPGGLSFLPAVDLGALPPDTKMVIVVGDEDTVVCKATGVAIWQDAVQIPDGNLDFLLVRSDRRGSPAQIANHFFPNTTGYEDTAAIDARDFFVTFKLSVAALNCAFEGTDCSYAFGGGAPEQVDMGTWSDGVPVLPMISVEDPSLLRTTCVDR